MVEDSSHIILLIYLADLIKMEEEFSTAMMQLEVMIAQLLWHKEVVHI